MLPKVLNALTERVEAKMKKEGNLNWTTIQNVDIKKDWGYPMACGTLYKIIRQPDYNYNKQIVNLLKHFNIKYNDNYGIITLVDEQDYEPKTEHNEE